MQWLKLGVTFVALGGTTLALFALKDMDPVLRALLTAFSVLGIIVMLPDAFNALVALNDKFKPVIEETVQKIKSNIKEDTRKPSNSMRWEITNSTSYDLNVEYYTQDGRGRWPNYGLIFPLRRGGTHSTEMSCTYGGYVCYGAWSSNKSAGWGQGYERSQSCSNCCYQCQGGTARVELVN